MHFKPAFGVLVSYFFVLWRPIVFHLSRSSRILCLFEVLHNYNTRDAPLDSTGSRNDSEDLHGSTERKCTEEAFRSWLQSSKNIRSRAGSVTLKHLARSTHRDLLANLLIYLGLTRPRSGYASFT